MTPSASRKQVIRPSSSAAGPNLTSAAASAITTTTTTTTTSSSSSQSSNRNRQYAHLHSHLAQLNALLADTENLVRMTTVQAHDIRFIGGYFVSFLAGSAKVLGEESLGQAE